MSGKHGAAAHGVRLMQYVTAETTRTSPERIEETQWKGIKNMAYGKGNGVEIQHMKHVIGYIYYLYEAYVIPREPYISNIYAILILSKVSYNTFILSILKSNLSKK